MFELNSEFNSAAGGVRVGRSNTPHTHTDTTYIACIGERPGLLSLPLLFACSIAPLRSSRIALAKLPRVGFPMEAVVYRDILFSAIEAYKMGKKQDRSIETGTYLYIYIYTIQHIQVTLPSFSFSLDAKDKIITSVLLISPLA